MEFEPNPPQVVKGDSNVLATPPARRKLEAEERDCLIAKLSPSAVAEPPESRPTWLETGIDDEHTLSPPAGIAHSLPLLVTSTVPTNTRQRWRRATGQANWPCCASNQASRRRQAVSTCRVYMHVQMPGRTGWAGRGVTMISVAFNLPMVLDGNSANATDEQREIDRKNRAEPPLTITPPCPGTRTPM